jgi:hypothetical protein
MRFFERVENLPIIPEYLLSDLDTIETFENTFPHKDYAHTYASYKADARLTEWLQDYFDFKIVVRYQVIKQKLPVHVDYGVSLADLRYNYLITTGGPNVRTRWWDSDKNPTRLLKELKAEKNTWHILNVATPHDITELDSPRISVTVIRASSHDR